MFIVLHYVDRSADVPVKIMRLKNTGVLQVEAKCPQLQAVIFATVVQ
jgi:hypothetical protein